MKAYYWHYTCPDRVSGQVTLIQPKRNGNGHQSYKSRRLTESERAWLKIAFLQKNGKIRPDDCVEFKRNLSEDVSIFQVTGYISVLHRYVAMGRVQVYDLKHYVAWMAEKYKPLWARFFHPKFINARQGVFI